MVSAPSVRKQRRMNAKTAGQQARRQRRSGRLPPIVWIIGAVMGVALMVGAVIGIQSWLTDPLERGRASMAAGNFRAARVDLMNAASRQPNDIAIQLDLARTYNALGRGVEAERQLDRAAELGANETRLRTVRAQAQLLKGDALAALALLAGPIPAAEGAVALRIAAQANYRLGNVAATRANFAEALRQKPDDADLWIAYARFRLAEQDLADADRAADEAWRLTPQSAAALAVKADVVRTRSGPVASIPWYQAGLARDPDNVPLMLEYAAALGEAGRYRDMLEPLRRAAGLEPRNSRALFLEAALAARGDEPALARTLLNRIAGGDADLPAVLQLRAAVELSLETPVAAAQYAQRLIALQPDNRVARRLLAMALASQENPRGAILAIDAITTQPDADSWSLILLSRSFGAIGWIDDSIQPLDRAARLVRGDARALPSDGAGADSLNPRVAVPAIRARLASGDYAQAMALAMALSNANPGVAQAWLLRGDVAMAEGDSAQALAHWQRAAELRFDEPVMLRMVDALNRSGDRSGAKTVLFQFMAHWPENTAAMRIAGAMFAEDGDWTRARTALLAAAQRVGSNDALLLAQLARCELELGRVSEAMPLARRAYRLLPGNGTVSGVYGLSIARSGGTMQDARDLLDKAVQLAPDDQLLQQWRAEVWE